MRAIGSNWAVGIVLIAILVCSAAVVLVSGRWRGNLPAYTSLPSPGGPRVPDRGAYLGAAVSPSRYLQPERIKAVQHFDASIGDGLSVVHVYVQWGTPLRTGPTEYFLNHRYRLLVSWATDDTRTIASGRDDASIVAMANQVRSIRHRIFLEPRWEMDRPNLASNVHSPEDFIAAWKRIRVIFSEYDVTNVSWVWCPTAKGFDDGRAQAYYPGDDMVDWICADGYPDPDSYESFASVFHSFFRWASHLTKPIMIGEFGVPRSYGSKRADWLLDAGRDIKGLSQIKAVIYFSGPAEPSSPGHDYRLQGDNDAMRALRLLAHSGYYIGGR